MEFASRPASATVIKFMPRLTVSESTENLCGTCLNEFAIGDTFVRYPCGHEFHACKSTSTAVDEAPGAEAETASDSDCECDIVPWMQRNCACPCCRFELPTDDDVYEVERKRKMKGHLSPKLFCDLLKLSRDELHQIPLNISGRTKPPFTFGLDRKNAIEIMHATGFYDVKPVPRALYTPMCGEAELGEARLPTFDVTEDFLCANGDKACGLCSRDLKVGDAVVKFPCGHTFHKESDEVSLSPTMVFAEDFRYCNICWWITKASCCPTCRFEIWTADVNDEATRKHRRAQRKLSCALLDEITSTWSLKQIKANLDALNVSYEGVCTEKSDFYILLQKSGYYDNTGIEFPAGSVEPVEFPLPPEIEAELRRREAEKARLAESKYCRDINRATARQAQADRDAISERERAERQLREVQRAEEFAQRRRQELMVQTEEFNAWRDGQIAAKEERAKLKKDRKQHKKEQKMQRAKEAYDSLTEVRELNGGASTTK